MEEVWKILVEENSVGVSSGSTGVTASSAAGTDSAIKQIPKKQLTFFDQFGKYFKLFLPIIGTAGVIYALAKSSSVTAAILEGVMAIFDMIASTLLAPLVPIFVSLLNLVIALMPVVQLLADILKPLADAIAKLIDWLRINVVTPAVTSMVDTFKTGKIPGMDKQESDKLYGEIDKESKKATDAQLSFWERLAALYKAWALSQLVPPSFYNPQSKAPISPPTSPIPNKNNSPSGYTEVNNTFNIDLQTSGSVDTLVNEIERRVKQSLSSMEYRRV